MRKPGFCIFLWPLYSDIILFIDHYCAGGGGGGGGSNKHCLLPFFILFCNIMYPQRSLCEDFFFNF